MKMARDHGKTVAADGFFNENTGNLPPLNKNFRCVRYFTDRKIKCVLFHNDKCSCSCCVYYSIELQF